MSERKVLIGIDLGTSKCCVGVFRDGNVDILENERGRKTTPSYVAFTDTERLVGEDAKDQALFNIQNTIHGIKRIIGRDFNDPLVAEYRPNAPCEVVEKENGIRIKVSYRGHEELLYPQQITASLLSKMKGIVETHLQCTVEQAVISVPASFTNLQRVATKEAATIAGLEVLALINETTAAALAYYNAKLVTKREVIVVVDFGGGKLDVSGVAVSENRVEVLAVSGSAEVGGEVLTEHIMNRVMQRILENFGDQFTPNNRFSARLRSVCEKAKRNLSLLPRELITIEAVGENDEFNMYLTRREFEHMIYKTVEPVLTRCLDKLFETQNLKKREVSFVIPVGGSSRIPLFNTWLKDYFGENSICKTVNPDEAIASGSAQYAYFFNECYGVRDFIVKDILSNNFCVFSDIIPDEQNLFVRSKVPIPAYQKIPYCRNLAINEKTASQTFKIYEKISDRNNLKQFVGDLSVSEEFAEEACTIEDVIFKIDRCGIFDMNFNLDPSQNSISGVVKNYVGNLKKEELSRAINIEEMFHRDKQEEIRRLEAFNDFEMLCFEITKDLETNCYNNFPEDVESLRKCTKEGLDCDVDEPASTEEILSKHKSLEKHYVEFTAKVKDYKMEILERTAAYTELSSLCSTVENLILTDVYKNEHSKTACEIKNEFDQIKQLIEKSENPSKQFCDERITGLHSIHERLSSLLEDAQQINALRNYCLDLRATIQDKVSNERCRLRCELLIAEAEDSLRWLDSTDTRIKVECARRMSSLNKLHLELAKFEMSSSEAKKKNANNPAQFIRKFCFEIQNLMKKCSKIYPQNECTLNDINAQIRTFLVSADSDETLTIEDFTERIYDILVKKVMIENTVKKVEQGRLSEKERMATLRDFQKSRASVLARIENVLEEEDVHSLMAKVADELLGWLETPMMFTKQEYEKRVQQWKTLNEMVNERIEKNENRIDRLI